MVLHNNCDIIIRFEPRTDERGYASFEPRAVIRSRVNEWFIKRWRNNISVQNLLKTVPRVIRATRFNRRKTFPTFHDTSKGVRYYYIAQYVFRYTSAHYNIIFVYIPIIPRQAVTLISYVPLCRRIYCNNIILYYHPTPFRVQHHCYYYNYYVVCFCFCRMRSVLVKTGFSRAPAFD